ncbi:MAG: inositol monophosphatase, partial [Candidatus Rokubacteria bacterium]|nr:inositol monophosphatase [Candidatus Rokubacteria bacterium]
MQEFRTVAVAAAQQAGKLIADAYRTDFRVDYKQGTTTNLVTEVDRRSEA